MVGVAGFEPADHNVILTTLMGVATKVHDCQICLSSSYHEFMYKSVECGIVKFKNEPWKGRRTYYFLGF
jgi:hypothetical protein